MKKIVKQLIWWDWRLTGAWEVTNHVKLPWDYSWKHLAAGEDLPGRVGSMLTFKATVPGVNILTPPLHMFADLTKINPSVDLRDLGSARFWIQPEIFQAAHGEIYQGDNVRDLIAISLAELVESVDRDADVMVALDAYLTKDRPDPRFV